MNTYNGPSFDQVAKISVDAEGSVYVVGSIIIKYDSDGRPLWSTNYDYATCLLTGPDSSVYVGGESGIVKYDASGHQVWKTALFYVTAMALDQSGNLYAVGRQGHTNEGWDYGTRKFDTNGNQIWVAIYEGQAHAEDLPCGIGLDEQGNVYVSGYASEVLGAYDYDFTTLKYDSNGQQLWVARHDGGDTDRAVAMAVDPTGNVYVVGFSRNYDSQGDYLTVKYDTEGHELWSTYHNPYRPWACGPRALAVDKAGSIWITGGCGTASTVLLDTEGRKIWEAAASGTSITVDEHGNAYVATEGGPTKLGPDGKVLWKATFPAGSVKSVAVGDGPNVYATGDTGYEIYTVAYRQSAPISNTTPFVVASSPRNSALYAVPAIIPLYAVAGDADGNVARVVFREGTNQICSLTNPPYRFMWSNNVPGSYSITAEAIDEQGAIGRSSPVRVRVNARNTLPTVSLTNPVERRFMARAQIPLGAAVSDIDGFVRRVEFYQGTNLLGVRTSAPYTMLWTNVGVGQYSLRAVAEDDRGGRHTSRPVNVAVNSQFLGKVEEEWLAHFNGAKHNHDVPAAMSLDAAGHVYVTGLADGGDIGTLKYGPDGSLLWSRTYDGPTRNGDEGRAIASDADGNVIVGGFSFSPTNLNDFTVIKYDSDGNEQWVRNYQGSPAANENVNAVTVDSAGNVYVTGPADGPSSLADYVTIKYDPNGERMWTQRYDGDAHQTDDPYAIVTDSSGAVYVTGQSWFPESGSDILTVAYGPDGALLWTKRFGGIHDDAGFGIALDAAGNLVVVGVKDSNTQRPRIVAVSYTPDGEERTRATAQIPGLSLIQLKTFYLDRTGDLYLGGETRSPIGKEDFITAKFVPRKGLVWWAKYNGFDSRSDGVRAMTSDGRGNVYVSGYSYINGDIDMITIKYRPKVIVQRNIR